MATIALQTIACRICTQKVPPNKRRQIFSPSFLVFNQLSQVLQYNPHVEDGLSKHICVTCYTKLNKLSKIDYDLQHRIDALRQEKRTIIQALRSTLPVSEAAKAHQQTTPSNVQGDQCKEVTPTKSEKKRKEVPRTPTPRKPKRALLSTPRKHGKHSFNLGKSSPSNLDILAVPLHQETGEIAGVKEKVSGTTIKKEKASFSPGHMRVQHQMEEGGPLRTRVIHKQDMKDIVKSIYRGDSHKCISKKMYKSDLQDSLTDCFLKDLDNQCKKLCSQKLANTLQKVNPHNLRLFKFSCIDKELSASAPLFYKTVSCLTGGSTPADIITGSMALFSRNNKMSLVQQAIGQVLDHCGTTDEGIATLNKMGVSVSTSTIARQRSLLQEQHEKQIHDMFGSLDTEQESIGMSHSVEIIGDNVDIVRTPAQMSKERRRKSWHWFLLLGVQKRVLFPDLQDDRPKADILELPNAAFVPDLKDCESLEGNFVHHVMHILVKYVRCLQNFESCLQSHISHSHEKETSQKSVYNVLDLLDKSENKTEDMISILEHIHDRYIPHSGDPPTVLQKKVFGGDCLTNERAYSAQLALLNSPTDHTMLKGVIHRPEGLHRMMNLCLVSPVEVIVFTVRFVV